MSAELSARKRGPCLMNQLWPREDWRAKIGMPQDAHNKAAEHHENAPKSHKMAAEHHGKGDHQKGREESARAQTHSKTARETPRWRIARAKRQNSAVHVHPPRPFCLPLSERRRHPGSQRFRGSMAGLYAPLPTLRRRPRGRLRTARGRCGSLLLHRSGLSPHTPCRSPGALTRVAARTLARSPICDQLHRRLQAISSPP